MSGSQGSTYKAIQFSINKGFGSDEFNKLEKVHKNKIVIQFACQDEILGQNSKDFAVDQPDDMTILRDGFDPSYRQILPDMSESWNYDARGLCYAKYVERPGWWSNVNIRLDKFDPVEKCKKYCHDKQYLYAVPYLAHMRCYCLNHLAGYTEKNSVIGGELNELRTGQLPAADKKRNTQRSLALASDQSKCLPCNRNNPRFGPGYCGGEREHLVSYVNIYNSGYFHEESYMEKNFRKNMAAKNSNQKGLHETWEIFDRCRKVENPTTFEQFYAGFECKFERENHPVSHFGETSMWNDLAIYTDSKDCSFENFVVSECIETWPNGKIKHKSVHKKQEDCESNSGRWIPFHRFIDIAEDIDNERDCTKLSTETKTFVWGRPMDFVALSRDQLPDEKCLLQPPVRACIKDLNTRNNIFSHADGTTDFPTFNWKIPQFYSQKSKNCVIRVRHFQTAKIDTIDDLPTTSAASFIDLSSENFGAKIYLAKFSSSVNKISNNLTLENRRTLRSMQKDKRLAPRVVFQDRSHIFKLRPRPENQKLQETDIHVISVRGKRGNIVQTFPAVEYDYVPTVLNIKNGQAVQFVWTGSNHHDNKNSQGNDGQTNAAGNGQGDTDRNNVMQIFAEKNSRNPYQIGGKSNFPVPFENGTLFGVKAKNQYLWAPPGFYADPKNSDNGCAIQGESISNPEFTNKQAFIGHATSGYMWCGTGENCGNNQGNLKTVLQLNTCPPNFVGPVFIPEDNRTFNFASTRNNDFSNRSQKGQIVTGNGSKKNLV